MAAPLPNPFHLVRYNIGGPAMYHERLTLLPGYILMPDGDDYAESSVAGGDLLSVHILSAQGEGLRCGGAGLLYHLSLADALRRQTETTRADWPVKGPRMLRWVPSFMQRMAGGPMAWHTRSRAMMQLGGRGEKVKLYETLPRDRDLLKP